MLTARTMILMALMAPLIATGLVFSLPAHAEDDEGRRIMTDVDNRYRGETWSMEVDLLLTDDRGRERRRSLRMLGKMFGDDERTLTYVTAPSRLRGIGILTYDWDDPARDNESWLYLPDLGRVTRLTTANRADYFLGTDFTYGDLEGLEVEDFDYEVDREAGNDDEMVVIAVPRDRDIVDKYGYQRIQYWVDTEKDVVVRAKYWMKNEGWIKYYSQFDFEIIDGVWLSAREQMVMTRNDSRVHSTVILRGDATINLDIPDNAFTTHGLERAAE
ncbi:outer membrane lipoprotein-sorting protein [Wenzhouxiangella sp. AB-CW3]|uniref:outer membrane lipoprotein-sorting protein n=1 Tax=Wenzhouxiangella sp. AB-CW3 TaxID=2771012 RepID=UPI00168A59E2|nr:outer membrane lipoprotein-sorting protein [Wenzhouxiangella sp. AB-CW3]QOC24052.1 outer membrane lipoprotein-sorting protein [Wenzhouxiangella sp. AB-CW3]